MLKNKAIQNAGWYIGCKVVQSLLQLLVGMLSARYLGPSNYGLINYAASVVAFAVPIMQLGLRATLVQEYVVSPEQEGRIMGTSLVMTTLSSAACIIGVVCFAMVANAGDTVTVIVCAVYSVQLLFQTLELLHSWYQAKLLSKYSSLAMLGSYIVVSAYKIFLLVSQKSVYWFALSHSVEYCSIGIAMLVIYKELGAQKLSFSWDLAKELFSRSKYYILASMMLTIYQNTDHVMLTLMAGDAENGFYTAAITCGCVVQFVFVAIMDTARPIALESHSRSQEEFDRNISRLYGIIIYLSIAQSVAFTVLAKLIVKLLYGNAFMQTVPVLKILTWNTAFAHIGSVRDIWILGEEKHRILWKINLSGVLGNVILNAVMIPRWGACGAALASVLTRFFANFILGFIMPSIRSNNRLLLKGLDPRLLWGLLKELKN